jgi:hypothetical protein
MGTTGVGQKNGDNQRTASGFWQLAAGIRRLATGHWRLTLIWKHFFQVAIYNLFLDVNEQSSDMSIRAKERACYFLPPPKTGFHILISYINVFKRRYAADLPCSGIVTRYLG